MSLYSVMQNLAPVFYKILYMSLTAAAAGVVVVLTRRFADKRFSPFWRYALWGLVVAALLIPWRPSSVFSVMSPAEELQKTSFINDYDIAEEEYKNELKHRNTFISSDELNSDDREDYSLAEQTERVKRAKKKADSLQIKTVIFDLLLPAFWLLGTAAAAVFLLFSAILLNKRINNTTFPAENGRYNIILEKCKIKLKIKRQVYIILQNHVKTPALFGLFRPKILLPEFAGSLSDEHLEYIILHELSHLKRGDGLVNALLLALQAVYWFNPLIWLFFKLAREDMELANDATVLKGMQDEERKEYSVSLVKTLAEYNKQRSFVPRLLCMVDNEKNIARRINMIKLGEFFKRRRLIISISGLLIITLTATLFLTVGRSKHIVKNEGINIGVCEKNGFILKIYSDKEKYTPSDEIKIWATLEYIGNKSSVRIWHGEPYISFTLKGDNGFDCSGLILTYLTSSSIKKNKLYRFEYVKSGEWEPDAPDAEYWEKFYTEKELRLPAGEYTVSVKGAFTLTEKGKDSESGLLCELPVKVADEILESESQKTFIFELPTEKNYMDLTSALTLYDNGTAKFTRSSLLHPLPDPLCFSVNGDELLFYHDEEKSDVARFEIIDNKILELRYAEGILSGIGTRYIYKPFDGTLSIAVQKSSGGGLWFNLIDYKLQGSSAYIFGPFRRFTDYKSLNKAIAEYSSEKIKKVNIKHSEDFSKKEISKITKEIKVPSKNYSVSTGALGEIEYWPALPKFDYLSEAAETLKTRPVATDGWEILYSDKEYLYITYKLGNEYIFRYNIKKNKIDRALNVNSKGAKDWKASTTFFADGKKAYLYSGVPEIANTAHLPYSSVHLIDFEKSTVSLITDNSKKFTLPGETDYYKAEDSGSLYEAAAKEYISLTKENPALPAFPSDWCNVLEIEPDIYLLIMPKDENNAWPGDGYAYFKIIIVNTKNNKVLQTYNINELK